MSGVYRNSQVHVLAAECKSCIFRSVNDGRIQGLAPGRVAEMVLGTREQDGGNIPCHSTLYDSAVQPAICRGWWDREADRDPMMRLAKQLSIATEDEVPA